MNRFISADDPVVADLLASTLELVAEAGGWVSPQARLVAREGQLGVECDGEPASPLFRIPRAACVRVDQVEWSDDEERLEITGLPDDIGDVELEMLYLQTALHNQCGKLPWLARTHPSLSPAVPDSLTTAVRALIPSFRTTRMHSRDVLFSNRCFRMPTSDGAGSERVLVPVVDLLDHHTAGSPGDWDGADFRVAVSRPWGGSACALDYGMDRDALEMAVVYGFADTSARLAHSAPMRVDVPGVGRVEIIGAGRSHSGQLLPVEATRMDGATVINRLTFDSGRPDAIVTDLMGATGWDRPTATAVTTEVRAANVILLGHLIDASAPNAPSAAAETLAAAARHQAAILTTEQP